MNAPGWQPDPTARHEYRYWDGSQWTDDVSDGGVTSTDPVDGSAAAAGGGDPDATQAIDPATQVYQGGPVPPADQGYPSGQYPPGTPAPGAAPSGPGYGGYDSGQYGGQNYGGYSGGGMPPGQPAKKGPNPVLIAVIALVAVLAIGGAAFALTSGGDDDDETSGSTTSTTAGDSTTTTTADSGDATDDTAGATPDTTLPDDLDDSLDDSLDDADSGDPSAVVGLLAEGVQQGAPNLTDEQAECIAQAMVDELGEDQIFELAGESGDPFGSLSAEQQAALTSQMLECAPADAFLDPGTGA